MTRAYRTTSYPALFTISGVPPIDLTLEMLAQQARRTRLREHIPTAQAQTRSEVYLTKVRCTHLHPAYRRKIQTDTPLPQDLPATIIYTDGSKSHLGVGAAYLVLKNDQLQHSWQGSLSESNSVFQAELIAVVKALEKVVHIPEREVAILTDSKSSLYAIGRFENQNPLVQKAQILLHQLQESGKSVTLAWVKAHVGTRGNELADQLAKDAVANPQVEQLDIVPPPSHLKRLLCAELQTTWQKEWENAEKGRITFEYLPKVTQDRLATHAGVSAALTEHGPFLTYLKRFRCINSSTCVCGEEGSAQHYMFDCSLTVDLHLRRPADAAKSLWADQVLRVKSLFLKLHRLYIWLQSNQSDICSAGS
jgi:ribonuclease HI